MRLLRGATAPAVLLSVAAGAGGPGQCSAQEGTCGKGKLKLRRCAPPAGHDLVPSRRLSLKAAVKACRQLSGCRAVTAEVGNDFQREADYEWHFKTTSEPCKGSQESRTVEVDHVEGQSRSSSWRPRPGHELESVELVQQDPPVLRLEAFLSDAEIQHIKSLALPRFVQSTVGMTYEAGQTRTSETAWLNALQDNEDEVLLNITARITQITRLPNENMEPFQVVRYQPGQSFQSHQDYLDEQEQQACGGRVGTFFMYLNDVPAGGETRFPDWGLSIKPESLWRAGSGWTN
ncbi:unnamed protein product [Durusdinium trenchii]|uniref:Prolyl 4-hydroxylase alpha subunit domain-containing protein n=1 Tax=Durusdinium trenchii TaxID=1381693 RepID=A0ABP0IEQ5_9DINO